MRNVVNFPKAFALILNRMIAVRKETKREIQANCILLIEFEAACKSVAEYVSTESVRRDEVLPDFWYLFLNVEFSLYRQNCWYEWCNLVSKRQPMSLLSPCIVDPASSSMCKYQYSLVLAFYLEVEFKNEKIMLNSTNSSIVKWHSTQQKRTLK